MSDELILSKRLRAAGLRVTGRRLAVLTSVQKVGQHRDVFEIAEAARKRLSTISTQAVYDNLDRLVESKFVRRIQLSGQSARCEARVGDNPHYLVCRRCGRTTNVDRVIGAAPCLEPSADQAYSIDEAEVIFGGICPQCQQKKHTQEPEEQQL